MTAAPDTELLKQFIRDNSEPAFAALVERHIALVHSVAWRHTADPQQAQDITQAVFIILARKAGSLSHQTILPGWLYHTARLTAANFQRAETRRRQREQEFYMRSTLQESPPEALWQDLSPLLDEAMAHLGARDRDALVLRYFKNNSLSEVAAAMGLAERAAQKRVTRAIEKLRKIFSKRGASLTTAIIAAAVSANSVQAAPAGLAVTVTTAAVKSAAVSGSSLTLIKGALKIMAWAKAKTAVVVGVAAILAVVTSTMIVKKATSSTYPSSWADNPTYWRLKNETLASYPQILILRPTRFSGRGGGIGYGNRWMEKDVAIEDLVGIAYGFPYTRLIFPEDFQHGGRGLGYVGYDLMLTLRHNPQKALRDEIAKQFGLVGHAKTIVTNVLLVKVANTGAPGLKRASSASGQGPGWFGDNWSVTIRDQPLDNFLGEYIESQVGEPVFNETGLTGRYNLHIQWHPQAGETDKEAFELALREQLGLELVPTNIPVEMLVVEKIN